MNENINLKLINRSNDVNNSEVLIFAKNSSSSFDEISVAWRVIKNLGRGDYHPFVYPTGQTISASDSWGNYTPQLNAELGQAFHMIKDTSGDVLQYQGQASSDKEIELKNDLTQGSINANVFKDGKLFSIKTNIAPSQKAVFSFKPNIFIGVVSQVQEGEVINSAIISSINTEFSLLGLSSADIIWTGGGAGLNSTPFHFSLENIVYQ